MDGKKVEFIDLVCNWHRGESCREIIDNYCDMYRKIAEGWRQNMGRRAGAGLAGLVFAVGVVGCYQSARQRANTARLLGFGMNLGAAGNSSLTPQERAIGSVTADTLNYSAEDQARIAAARERRSDIDFTVNIPGQNYQQPVQREPIYTIEIWNLDTGEKEIEMIGLIFSDYFKGKRDLAEKYQIIEKTNGVVDRDFTVEAKVENKDGREYNYFYREGKIVQGVSR